MQAFWLFPVVERINECPHSCSTSSKNADAESVDSASGAVITRTFVSAAPVPGRVPAAAMHYPRNLSELRAAAGQVRIPWWWVG